MKAIAANQSFFTGMTSMRKRFNKDNHSSCRAVQARDMLIEWLPGCGLQAKPVWDMVPLNTYGVPAAADAGNSRMVEQRIPLKFTRSGKWNLAAVATGSMINAGHDTVRRLLKNAKGLVVSGIDIQ